MRSTLCFPTFSGHQQWDSKEGSSGRGGGCDCHVFVDGTLAPWVRLQTHLDKARAVPSVQSRGARARGERGSWLEPALSTAPLLGPVVGRQPVPPTGSGWLHAQAAFQAAGWAAGSQPSARGERGGLSIRVPTTQSRPLAGHKTPTAFVVERNIQSRAGRGQGSPLLWERTLPGPRSLFSEPSVCPRHPPTLPHTLWGSPKPVSQSHPCSLLGNAFRVVKPSDVPRISITILPSYKNGSPVLQKTILRTVIFLLNERSSNQ